MRALKIAQAKPNPTGKDWFPGDIPSRQLAGEWVDFKNVGNESFSLRNVALYHVAYQPGCINGKWEKVEGFKGILGVNEVVRVHSGGRVSLSELDPIDVQGADYHLFTGISYIWNNDCKDKPSLYSLVNEKWIDQTFYDPNPPEGEILVRVGDKLVPSV